MGGLGTITRSSSLRKGKVQALQMMYFLEGGLLMASNLLQTDAWVDDQMRTHCSVCVQQFLPFRRRHHCRTCGEVVCGGCSSQRAVRLTDMNVECTTRVCTYCVIRATDASIKASDDAIRQTQLEHGRLSTVSVLSLASPAVRRNKQLTLLSAESELTRGSIVQLWPQPVPPNETARLRVARHATIRSAESDPTMNLLVNIVARTLECPAAFIGIMDDASLWIKASVGLDDRVTHIPREGCMCAHTVAQDRTMVIDDTTADKHFHAEEQAVGSNSMRYYAGAPIRVRGHGIGVVCALDAEPHAGTTDAMKSTLEAVANIVSEVLEQRIASDGTTNSPTGLSCYVRPQTTHTDVDLHTSLQGLNVLPRAQQPSSSRSHSPALYLPPQYASKITAAVDYFHQLQRSAWTEQSAESGAGGIRSFELFEQEEPFTRSVVKVSGTCRGIVAQLLDYEDALLYQQFFSHVSRRRELNGHTWMDSVSLHPSFGAAENESLSVLTHRREYPDGSNVVVAVARNAPEEEHRSGLLIGWFVAPCDGLNAANVSCITAQAFENQAHERNLSLDLLRRLNQKIAMSRFFHLPADDAPTSATPSTLQLQLRPALRDTPSSKEATDEDDQDGPDSNDRDNTVVHTSGSARATSVGRATDSSIDAAPESNRSALVAIHQTEQASQLNQNEQMLLDLLDKTISTQEILAQRQHEMAGVINLHGDQLQRISSALERVESLLFDKDGKPLKRLARKPRQAART